MHSILLYQSITIWNVNVCPISKVWKIYLWKFCILLCNIYLFWYLLIFVDDPRGGAVFLAPALAPWMISFISLRDVVWGIMQWATRLEECVLTKRVDRSESPSLFLSLTSCVICHEAWPYLSSFLIGWVKIIFITSFLKDVRCFIFLTSLEFLFPPL